MGFFSCGTTRRDLRLVVPGITDERAFDATIPYRLAGFITDTPVLYFPSSEPRRSDIVKIIPFQKGPSSSPFIEWLSKERRVPQSLKVLPIRVDYSSGFAYGIVFALPHLVTTSFGIQVTEGLVRIMGECLSYNNYVGLNLFLGAPISVPFGILEQAVLINHPVFFGEIQDTKSFKNLRNNFS